MAHLQAHDVTRLTLDGCDCISSKNSVWQPMTNSISAFISELIRDANQIEKLGDYEKRRMLERAVTTIRDIRETIGIPASSKVRDVVIDLQTTANLIEHGHVRDEHVMRSFLVAADVLRTLKILLDAADEAKRTR